MRCNSVLLRLDPLRTGALDAPERQVVEDHIGRCRSCNDYYRELTRIAELAPALMGECPTSCADSLLRRLVDGYDRLALEGVDLWVAFSAEGITTVAAGAAAPERLARDYAKRFRREVRRSPLPEALKAELAEALRGAGRPRPDVDLSRLPDFKRRVLETLLTIPKGEVRTYAWVAREAGKPAAVRAVGNTCARNPVPFVVPCHRVVPSSGGVGRYLHGSAMKRSLLAREGVDVSLIDRLSRTGARYVLSAGGEEYCFPTCSSLESLGREDLIPIRDEREAEARGLRPCDRCRPLARAA